MFKKVLVIATVMMLTLIAFPLVSVSAVNGDSYFYTIGNSNFDHVYDDIPFKVWGTSLHVEKTPSIEPIMTDHLSLPSLKASNIHILQSSGHATTLIDGDIIGQIKIFYSDETFITTDLVMGVNTAEWSYDSSYYAPNLSHTKIPAAYSFPSYEPDGTEFSAHLFYIGIEANPAKTLDRIELVLDSDLSATRDYLGASIHAITLETSIVAPGWDKGKKPGWDGSFPPGLSKKDNFPPV